MRCQFSTVKKLVVCPENFSDSSAVDLFIFIHISKMDKYSTVLKIRSEERSQKLNKIPNG